MEQLHFSMRRKHYSPRTEQAYRYWIRQYIFFHKKQHPSTLNGIHITAFLNYLATKRSVSVFTQSQALNALIYLYKQVLGMDVGELQVLNKIQPPPNGYPLFFLKMKWLVYYTICLARIGLWQCCCMGADFAATNVSSFV